MKNNKLSPKQEQLKKVLKPIVEGIIKEESKFGIFNKANDWRELIPNYKKEFQSYLNSNRGGNLIGITSAGGNIMIIGDKSTVTIDKLNGKPVATALLHKG
jgi:hypothetical protein